MSTQSVAVRAPGSPADSGFHTAFVVAWLFCLVFYFIEYAMRSAGA